VEVVQNIQNRLSLFVAFSYVLRFSEQMRPTSLELPVIARIRRSPITTQDGVLSEFVAVVGKPHTYETDDGAVNVSLRPEHLTIVDEAVRHRWVTETAERTLDRLEAYR
jgi:hypothetical protein